MIRSPATIAAFLMLTASVSGCSVLPAQAPQPQLHDFGPMPVPKEGAELRVRIDQATAAAWLDDGAIHYRLVYSDPTSLRSYADHRWVGAPSEMLRLRLDYLLHGAASPDVSAGPVYALSVELLQFEQDFTSAQHADAQLVIQAALRSSADGRLVAQQQFVLSGPSTADVHGAVSGLSGVADQAAGQIVAWCEGIASKAR